MIRPKPSPDQIAMFGHIASALRAVMHKHQWSVRAMNEALGLELNSTTLYSYLGCRSQPKAAMRKLLYEKFGIPEHELLKRDIESSPATRSGARHVATVATTDHVATPHNLTIIKPMSPNPVLSFTVSADGTARIKLDAAMSLSDAAPLLRILLDAGIVPSTQGDNNGSLQ